MTCIVGVEHEGRVWLGADSLVSVGDDAIESSAIPKVWESGSFVFGAAGLGLFSQILRKVCLPAATPQTVTGVVTSELPRLIRQAISEADASAEADGQFNLLVGGYGHLFQVDGLGHVSRSRHGYSAIGSGAPFGLAALGATTGDPKRRLKKALKLAEQHCAWVRRPWSFVVTPNVH